MELTTHPFSMRMALNPAFCTSMAQAMPVGPAPTTRTSFQESGCASACARGRVSGICSTANGVRGFMSVKENRNSNTVHQKCCAPDFLLLHANRNPVANRQDSRKQILRFADQFVELQDGFGLGV